MPTTVARIIPRRGTAAAWTAANPVLADGERGHETDTDRWKIGDGTTAWNALAYEGEGGGGGGGAVNTVNGQAPDGGGNVLLDASQVPNAATDAELASHAAQRVAGAHLPLGGNPGDVPIRGAGSSVTWGPQTGGGGGGGAVDSVNGRTGAVALRPSDVGMPYRLAWHENDDWANQLATVVVNPDSPAGFPTLTADRGVGVATGQATGGNDRRIHTLLGVALADAELYIEYEASAGAQVGLVFRETGTKSVHAWQNIFLTATGPVLGGVWRYNGSALLNTNQLATDHPGVYEEVAAAVGDGTTVTVMTQRPHHVAPGELVTFTGVGAFGQVTVATTPTPSTLTFANATVGTWTGGSFRHVSGPVRRRLKARLVGVPGIMQWKQWHPDEDEPAWSDTNRTATATLPATLDDGSAPPTTGGVGFLLAHTGGSKTVRVLDFQAVDLQQSMARMIGPTPGRDIGAAGEASARLDRLGRVGVVVKRQVGSAYVWPGGIAPPAGSYVSILFVGSGDPASTTGGRSDPNDVWTGGLGGGGGGGGAALPVWMLWDSTALEYRWMGGVAPAAGWTNIVFAGPESPETADTEIGVRGLVEGDFWVSTAALP